MLGKYLCCEQVCFGGYGAGNSFFLPVWNSSDLPVWYFKVKGCHKKVQKEHWPYLMILGGLGYFAAIILQLAGTARLSGSLSSLMNSLNPVAISVMAAIFLKERITWKMRSALLYLLQAYMLF